jgi:predicted ABC-type ATPase
MSVNKPQIFVIAGPNGSGKTTSAKTLLPDMLLCYEYVNADAVAAALSPFNPDNVAMRAGRLMLERIQYLAEQHVNFAFETTLASRTFINFLNKCKENGYQINIL